MDSVFEKINQRVLNSGCAEVAAGAGAADSRAGCAPHASRAVTFIRLLLAEAITGRT
ncbi:MAG: hypothetical protein Q8N39_04300 [Pelolinea sp.]|nr:hypothetical protein [Pelolinea sp.]